MTELRSFTAWIYRPYVDLGPAPPRAPYHAYGVEFARRNLMEAADIPRTLTSTGPAFRAELGWILRLPAGHFASQSVFDVEPGGRSAAWESLCAQTEEFAGLSVSRQLRVAWLLLKLGFFDDVRRLLPTAVIDSDRLSRSPEDAGLALVRSFTDLHSDRYDPKVFEAIATYAPPSTVKVEALYQLVLFHSKYLGDLDSTNLWMAPFLAAIEEIAPSVGHYVHMQLMSLYHRVGGFVPMMQRDKDGVAREMGLAEEYAATMPRDTLEHQIGADEMTYYMLESRVKEALWLGDIALAEERAERLTALSPNDARGWLTFGQVLLEKGDYSGALQDYVTAVRLAPPGVEVALFMEGQCREALGDLEGACNAYMRCLDADPFAISAAESLLNVATAIGASSISAWAARHIELLPNLTSENARKSSREFYRQAPAPTDTAAK
jgi:tetratricopeptide (TPR) repeat protein